MSREAVPCDFAMTLQKRVPAADEKPPKIEAVDELAGMVQAAMRAGKQPRSLHRMVAGMLKSGLRKHLTGKPAVFGLQKLASMADCSRRQAQNNLRTLEAWSFANAIAGAQGGRGVATEYVLDLQALKRALVLCECNPSPRLERAMTAMRDRLESRPDWPPKATEKGAVEEVKKGEVEGPEKGEVEGAQKGEVKGEIFHPIGRSPMRIGPAKPPHVPAADVRPSAEKRSGEDQRCVGAQGRGSDQRCDSAEKRAAHERECGRIRAAMDQAMADYFALDDPTNPDAWL